MHNISRESRLFILLLSCAGFFALFGQVSPEDRPKLLLAMISSQFDSESQNGAGLILGVQNNRLYIVTANHVVRVGPRQAKSVKVKLQWLPGESFPADLTDNFDANADIAVLVIKDANKLSIPALPFDLVGDSASLRRGTQVHSMGYPRGEGWFSRPAPDYVAQSSIDSIQFDSSWIAPGYSGGGLFNERWQLVGMIQKDNPPTAEAMPVERLLNRVRQWGYPVQLGRSAASAPTAVAAAAPPASAPARVPESGPRAWAAMGIGYSASYSCAMTNQIEIYCWGANGRGELGSGVGPDSYVPRRVSVPPGVVPRTLWRGPSHACFLTADGLAYCWGSNQTGAVVASEEAVIPTPRLVTDRLRFRNLVLGVNFSCGQRSEPLPGGQEYEMFCWGKPTGLPVNSRTPIAVPGLSFSGLTRGLAGTLCGTKFDNQAFCAGVGSDGQLGDGRVHEFPETIPVRVAIPEPVNAVSAGYRHACAVGRSGAAYCWGKGPDGTLGLGADSVESLAPAAIPGRSDFLSVLAGSYRTCAMSRDRQLLCWGRNGVGEIGNGTTENAMSPTPVRLAEPVRSYSLGGGHSCAIGQSGKLYCWGFNRFGQLGVGNTNNSLLPLEVPLPPQ